MRTLAAALALVVSCSSPARTVITVQPGVELVCTARSSGPAVALVPDAAVRDAAPEDVSFELDAAVVTPTVDAAADVPDVDPARLALLPVVERSWGVARVARCEGARAVLVQRDARFITRPLAALRAARLVAGAEVTALWQGGATPYHAVVMEVRGDDVRVRYDDGTEETVDPLRIDSVITAVAPSPARVCPIAAGAVPTVLIAREAWQRAAAVVECGGASALVETIRDGRQLVPVGTLSRATFARGDRVMVRWRDGADWAARVDRAEATSLAVTYDDGTEETIAYGQVVAWAAGDGATRPAAPYACPR